MRLSVTTTPARWDLASDQAAHCRKNEKKKVDVGEKKNPTAKRAERLSGEGKALLTVGRVIAKSRLTSDETCYLFEREVHILLKIREGLNCLNR